MRCDKEDVTKIDGCSFQPSGDNGMWIIGRILGKYFYVKPASGLCSNWSGPYALPFYDAAPESSARGGCS